MSEPPKTPQFFKRGLAVQSPVVFRILDLRAGTVLDEPFPASALGQGIDQEIDEGLFATEIGPVPAQDR